MPVSMLKRELSKLLRSQDSMPSSSSSSPTSDSPPWPLIRKTPVPRRADRRTTLDTQAGRDDGTDSPTVSPQRCPSAPPFDDGQARNALIRCSSCVAIDDHHDFVSKWIQMRSDDQLVDLDVVDKCIASVKRRRGQLRIPSDRGRP
eukprot:Polyplicarium_translucidae@DN2702_c0_g1_i3.p1